SSSLLKIFRGKIQSNQVNNYDRKILHSTNCGTSHSLPSDFLYENNDYFLDNNIKYAERGDIIVCRIGRNFYKKVFFVEEGFIAVSDHFFVVKVKPKNS